MGLITGLLTLPLAPVRGVAWIGEQVAIEADRRLDPATRLRSELAQLELRRETGELSDAEFEALEDELLEEELPNG
jgi:hypothetical protein